MSADQTRTLADVLRAVASIARGEGRIPGPKRNHDAIVAALQAAPDGRLSIGEVTCDRCKGQGLWGRRDVISGQTPLGPCPDCNNGKRRAFITLVFKEAQ